MLWIQLSANWAWQLKISRDSDTRQVKRKLSFFFRQHVAPTPPNRSDHAAARWLQRQLKAVDHDHPEADCCLFGVQNSNSSARCRKRRRGRKKNGSEEKLHTCRGVITFGALRGEAVVWPHDCSNTRRYLRLWFKALPTVWLDVSVKKRLFVFVMKGKKVIRMPPYDKDILTRPKAQDSYPCCVTHSLHICALC